MTEKNLASTLPHIGFDIDINNLDIVINKLEKITELASNISTITPIDDYLLKLSDVANVMGVNITTVNKIVKSGKLRVLKIGCTKVRKKELDRFLAYAEESGLTLEDLN